jgi:hypothetical protein
MVITLILLQVRVELETLFEVVENHNGSVIWSYEVWMSCTDGWNEMVLVETAPLTVELLVHLQSLRAEALYKTDPICCIAIFPKLS